MSDALDPTRPDLPTGTVTFLFSDIEGSTRLLDRLGAGYPEVLETHQRLLREAFGRRGGIEITTEGDSFFVVFASAPDAVGAAVEAQRLVAQHDWPPEGPVRVRMGVHTGEGVLGADNYVGVDVHRAARIAAAGHGGQVVASGATAALVEHAEGLTLRDLGEHRLKDLPSPEHLFQVVAEGLETDFPPLRSMDARPNNLPLQLTSFVGRSREIDEIERLVDRTRLLTLTGPGGTGKTRLSIQVASDLLPGFEDGAFFVALSPITDPQLVASTMAQALGLREASDRPAIEVVIEHVRDKRLLLVLDNFEQVLEAAGEVGQLLSATEGVTVLTTSREPLGLHGEAEYPVPPLGVPDPEHLPSVGRLSQYEAVALFIERATAVKPGFAVTNQNAPAIAQICARLDGLPLAIELAAARAKILDPEALLARLEHALTFLTGGARDVPARQQTLRHAIAWSHDLLAEDERRLFARLSVFVGGFPLEAVDAVVNPDAELGLDTLEGVASLANKSLLRRSESKPGEPRFVMLETIREYAAERLSENPAEEEIHRRHAAFYLALAERAGPDLTGPHQVHWLERLSEEHDNFRAALTWAERTGELDTALRLGGSLWRFWQMRGHLREARERLDRLLSLPPGSATGAARAVALEGAGGVAYWMGDFAAARRWYEECLELRRRLEDKPGIAEATYNLAFALAIAPKPLQDMDTAARLLEDARDMFEELGDRRGVAKALWGLATAAYQLESWERAAELAADTVELFRELDDRFGLAWALHLKGLALAVLYRSGEARDALNEALGIFLDADDRSAFGLLLGDLAILAASEGDRERAIRLAGAAVAAEDEVGTGLLFSSAGVAERVRELGDVLPRPESERIYAEGKAMSADRAIAYAREGLEQGPAL